MNAACDGFLRGVLKSETEVADGIARAFAFKTRPVVMHCVTSAVQMSAWRRYTRTATLPRRWG
jgi:acetolactate synthase-1/2/3 large subunit